MEINRSQKWREEARLLTSDELDDELLRPTGDWKEDVLREAIRRILKKQNE